MGISFLALWSFSFPRCCSGLNWAQVSGNRTQPVSVPQFNGWTQRWGHALAVDESSGYLYLLGGDDFRGSHDGGGMMHNDVWRTSGVKWSIFEKVTTKEPRLYSQFVWERVGTDKLAPRESTYFDWLDCLTRPWRGIAACRELDDPYQGDLRRWSPRRNHAAVYFKEDESAFNTLWVIGGRAADETGAQIDHSVVLKNDVWASQDGLVWSLINPGCRFDDVQAAPGVGAEDSECTNDNDCFGDSHCIQRRCECQSFLPRERHAVSVFGGELYLSGGVIHVRETDCGDFPCNDGYTRVADDLWRSRDGKTWSKVATIRHRYKDHALIPDDGKLWILSTMQDPVDVFLSSPSSQLEENSKRGTFLRGIHSDEKWLYLVSANEIYAYEAGTGWRRLVHDAINKQDSVYVWSDAPVNRVQGGITSEEALILRQRGVDTIRDLAKLGPQTVVKLREKEGITHICRYLYRAKAIVNKCREFTDLPDGHSNFTQVVQIREPMTHPFPNLRGTVTAESVSLAASAKEERGELSANKKEEEPHFIYGHDGCQQAELTEEKFEHLSSEIPSLTLDAANGYLPDVTCRWEFGERTNIGAIEFQGHLLVVGGLITHRPKDLVLAEKGDTWYLDDIVPTTLILQRPGGGSSETVFSFGCDEEACLFEFTIEIMSEDDGTVLQEILPWTLTIGQKFDIRSYLPGGGRYRLKVRALDPAGNVEVEFEENRNQYTWNYVPAIPFGLIIGIIIVFILIAIAAYLEMRRRKKKAALERYALKRMRRKFKGMKKRDNLNGKKKNNDKELVSTKNGKKKGKGKKKKKNDHKVKVKRTGGATRNNDKKKNKKTKKT